MGGACRVGSCNAGFADCNADPADGCETNTQTESRDCGRCGNVCTAPTGRTAYCAGGACMVGATCSAPLADCDGVSSNGCEVNTGNDPLNCASCGNRCVYANAAASCASGVCAMGVCNAGFGDCDGSATNGCEANFASSVPHCGRVRERVPVLERDGRVQRRPVHDGRVQRGLRRLRHEPHQRV